ncbi:Ig-like domain repeat protein [Methanobrevibacter sp.]|uniref:Ig-like domain repeat protein n=1 Tax=Methanobrevibacter sp. TaxID=66852 RepID=UPI0038638E7F
MALLSISAVSAEMNDTLELEDNNHDSSIYIDNQKGNDFNAGDITSPVKSISQAVNNAENNSDIYLSSDTYSGDKNTRITVDKSLNFIGNNTVIDGEGKNYLFTITGNVNVTFKNIHFINAYKSPESYSVNYPDSVYGSALEIKNANVILDNCTFQSNVLDYSNNNRNIYGGAISNDGTLIVTHSKFLSNIAHSTSGLFSYGGSIYNNAKLIINQSEFLKSDSDDFSYGGVIANNGDLTIDNTLITNSKSSQESRGGVVYNTGNFKLTNSIIENSVISKANFQYVYGAIYNAGTFTAYSNIFRNNTGVYSTPSRGSPTIYSTGKLNLTYNLFLGNVPFEEDIYKDVYISSGEIISLDNNWWGSNDDPTTVNAVNLDDEINSWLVLNITPDYCALNIGQSVDINVNWASSLPVEFNRNLIPKSEIIINANTHNFTNQLTYNYGETHVKGLYQIPVILNDFLKIVEIDVGKIKTELNISLNDNLTYGDDLIVDISINGEDNLNPEGIILISIGDNVYNITLENGHANYAIGGLNPGTYNVKVSYNGSDNYFKSFYTSKVSVNKRSVYMNLTIPEFFIDESYYVNVNLVGEGSKSSAVLYINGVRKKILYLYDDRENKISLTGFGEGEYNITIAYTENTYFNSCTVSGILKIKKYSPVFNITAPDIMLGETQTVKITVDPGDLRGEAILNINGYNYQVFLNDTVSEITISDLKAGVYNLNFVFDGDAKYSKAVASTSFSVLKYPITLNVTVNYNETTFKGNILVKTNHKNCTGEVTVLVNYKIYALNLTNGEANFPITYDKGSNYIYVYYEGDDYWNEASWNTTIGVADEFILMGADVSAYEHNDFNYSFRLIEPTGLPLPSRDVTIRFKDNVYTVSTDDDGYGYFKLNLAEGTYTIKAIYQNKTVTNSLEVKKIIFSLNSNNVTYGNQSVFTASFDKNVTGKVNFTISNVLSEIVNITNGKAELTVSYIDVGVYSVQAFYFNDYFNSTGKSNMFEVGKADSIFDLAVSNVVSGEDANITLTLSNMVSGEVVFILDGKKSVVEIIDNKAVLFVPNISGADHIISINYDGDRNYNPKSLNSSFYIRDLRSGLLLSLANITYGEALNVTAKLDANTTGEVTFNIGDITKTANIVNGEAVLSFNNLDAGVYNLSAFYDGDAHYIAATNSTSFEVFKANSTISLKSNAVLGENILIYAYLPQNASGFVSFSMPGYYTSRDKEIDDSIALWYISPLDKGLYTVRAKYKGDDNYYPSETTYLINLSENNPKLSVVLPDITSNERVNVKVHLTVGGIGITDKVTLKLNSREYSVLVRNGSGSLVIGKLPVGSYDWEVTYGGSDEYCEVSTMGSFKVADQLQAILSSKNVTKYYKGDENLTVYLKDLSGNPISNQIINVKLNGGEYNLTTNNDGIASMRLNLASGEYLAEIRYEGSDKYYSDEMNVSVSIKSTVEGIDVVKVYGTGTQYFAIFLDSNGRAIGNTDVTFKIGSKSYTATTLPNGITRLNINLNPGRYSIVAINPFTGEKATNSLFIFNKLMENSDLTMYYTQGKYYRLRAYTDNGTPVGAGKTVTFKINGKTYSRTTDNDGYAMLKISLKPKTYTIVASFNGFSVKNKITVKSVVAAKNLKFKKSSKSVKIKVSLRKVNGKYLKNKKITLKFNKKTFKAKTNKKGVATFTIKNSVYKKLKTNKKYTYQVIYAKDKVKKTIKFKK